MALESNTSISKPMQHDDSPTSSDLNVVDATSPQPSTPRVEVQRPAFGKFLNIPMRSGESRQLIKRPVTPESPKFLTVPKWKYGNKSKGRGGISDPASGIRPLRLGGDSASVNSDTPVKPLAFRSYHARGVASLNAQDHSALGAVKELGDEDAVFGDVDQLFKEIRDLQEEFSPSSSDEKDSLRETVDEVVFDLSRFDLCGTGTIRCAVDLLFSSLPSDILNFLHRPVEDFAEFTDDSIDSAEIDWSDSLGYVYSDSNI